MLEKFIFNELYKIINFTTLSDNDLKIVENDVKERYLVYTFLKYSNTQHGTLKNNLINNYCKNNNYYSKTRQEILYLLDKYSKITVTKMIISEEPSFAQTGGQDHGGNNSNGGNNQEYNIKY